LRAASELLTVCRCCLLIRTTGELLPYTRGGVESWRVWYHAPSSGCCSLAPYQTGYWLRSALTSACQHSKSRRKCTDDCPGDPTSKRRSSQFRIAPTCITARLRHGATANGRAAAVQCGRCGRMHIRRPQPVFLVSASRRCQRTPSARYSAAHQRVTRSNGRQRGANGLEFGAL
jgi:hypothetical protein